MPADSEVLKEKHVIGMSASNSSGDVYHVLSYLFTFNIDVQNQFSVWVYTDNTSTTEKQYNRIANFARALGVGNLFSHKEIKCDAHYQLRREEQMQANAAAESKKDALSCYGLTHQRGTTTLLADSFKTHGKQVVTTHLRNRYRLIDYNQLNAMASNQNAGGIVEGFVEKSMQKIASTVRQNQPMIILHVRHVGAGKGVNEHQNLTDDFVAKFGKYLESKGFNVWYIFADDRIKNSFSGIKSKRISPFAGKWAQLHDKDKDKPVLSAKAKKDRRAPVDEIFAGFYKLLHLHLLIRLYDVRANLNLFGVVGNTSGTLDLAAFLGHDVYDIHTFSQPQVGFQDYRLLMQMLFLTVESINKEALERVKQRTPVYHSYNFTDNDVTEVIK